MRSIYYCSGSTHCSIAGTDEGFLSCCYGDSTALFVGAWRASDRKTSLSGTTIYNIVWTLEVSTTILLCALKDPIQEANHVMSGTKMLLKIVMRALRFFPSDHGLWLIACDREVRLGHLNNARWYSRWRFLLWEPHRLHRSLMQRALRVVPTGTPGRAELLSAFIKLEAVALNRSLKGGEEVDRRVQNSVEESDQPMATVSSVHVGVLRGIASSLQARSVRSSWKSVTPTICNALPMSLSYVFHTVAPFPGCRPEVARISVGGWQGSGRTGRSNGSNACSPEGGNEDHSYVNSSCVESRGRRYCFVLIVTHLSFRSRLLALVWSIRTSTPNWLKLNGVSSGKDRKGPTKED